MSKHISSNLKLISGGSGPFRIAFRIVIVILMSQMIYFYSEGSGASEVISFIDH